MNKTCFALAVGALLCAPAAWAANPTRYTIELLGDLPGGITTSQGMALDSQGNVVGQSTSADGYFATRWAAADRTPVSLGDLPGGVVSSMAYGVNDAGVVVGTAGGSSGVRAFRLSSGGAMVDLGDLPGGTNASGAYAVNGLGVAVGYSYSAASGNNPTAVRWSSNGVATELGDLAGGLFSSQARAINDAGTIAGTGYDASGRRAWVYTDQTGMQALPTLPAGSFADAYGLNEQGWVVGSSIGSGSTLHGVLWHDGQVFDLGPAGKSSYAMDINNRNQIVGASEGHAALWTTSGQLLDLNGLIDGAPQGLLLTNALAINDRGQITGYGSNGAGQRVGFVLTEVSAVPEPGSWALLLAGLAASGPLLRRRARRD